MSPASKSRLRYTGIAVAVVAVFYFVWPTPYEYTRKPPDIFRVNRFTGVRETATTDGWERDSEIQAKLAKAVAARKAVEEADLAALTKAKVFPPLTVGNHSAITANCVSEFVSGGLRGRLDLSPFTQELQTVVDDTSRAYAVTVKFLDSNGFTVGQTKLVMSEMTSEQGTRQDDDNYTPDWAKGIVKPGLPSKTVEEHTAPDELGDILKKKPWKHKTPAPHGVPKFLEDPPEGSAALSPSNPVIALRAEFDIPMTEADYRRVSNWTCEWQWPK